MQGEDELKCKSCPGVRKPVHFGRYYRKSDRKWIQRYRCALCGKIFSKATAHPAFGQKKRQINHIVFKLLASGVSQRRIARILNVHPMTVSRKLEFLGNQARHWNYKNRQKIAIVQKVQFDDLETFEHTKLKPLSVTLAVEKHSRFILAFEVSRMPAKGLIAKKSRKKYGFRKDERGEGQDRLFRRIERKVSNLALFESDNNPMYPKVIKKYFPKATHQTVQGARGCVTGQGELKALPFDPLFSLNHTCAMFRGNVNRLIRKTWCTTKKIQPLINHLEIYTKYHNQKLIRV